MSTPTTDCRPTPPTPPPTGCPTTVRPHAYRLVLTPDLRRRHLRRGRRDRRHRRASPPPRSSSTRPSSRSPSPSSTTATPTTATPSPPTAIDLDADEERATLTFAEPLPPGPATLHLAFTGILNDKLHGFYRSTFTDETGAEHVIATTQMESTDARRAFPCWDEPDLKATFEVTLVVDDALAAYSNGPVVEETPERRRQAAGPVRPHHGHVHLPGGLHRRARSRPPTRSTSTACPSASSTRRARAT